MSRPEQYERFLRMVMHLFWFCKVKKIPIRLGEAHRPKFVAIQYVLDKVGILKSKHRWSLAIDLWITSESGKGIMWKDERYRLMGIHWEKMGGVWGGKFKRCDPYHFEIKEDPA